MYGASASIWYWHRALSYYQPTDSLTMSVIDKMEVIQW